LFIDEIGDLTPRVQGMFLKALEEKRAKRMGEAFYLGVDFRLISAADHDLEAKAAELMNIARPSLQRMMKEASVERP